MIAMAWALAHPGPVCQRADSSGTRKNTAASRMTHAWCELLFPSAGWIGFDPANNCIVGGNFIKVAVGRDFGDVPPNRGIFRGKARESIDVAVQSEELRAVPSELAAERLQSLSIPTFPGGSRGFIEQVNQQQEQQQQGMHS